MAATIMKIISNVNKFDFWNKHILVHMINIMQHILVQLKNILQVFQWSLH